VFNLLLTEVHQGFTAQDTSCAELNKLLKI
jgi:hypothetical protein